MEACLSPGLTLRPCCICLYWCFLLCVQLPQRLAAACCAVLKTPRPAPTRAQLRSTEQPLVPHELCISMLQTLLLFAWNCKVIQSVPHPLARALGEQFQQSGLLQLLPGLMTDAAARWEAAAEAAPSASSSGSTSGGSSKGKGKKKAGGQATQQQQQEQECFELLYICNKLNQCWPSNSFKLQLLPDCLEPSLALAHVLYR